MIATERLEKLVRSGLAQVRDVEGQEWSTLERAKRGPQIRSSEPEEAVVDGRRIRYVWSTETVDRAGDIVRQNWDLGPFTRNPIALYNHDHDVVLGRALDFGVELGSRKALVGTIEYAPEGTDPLIDSRYKLAAAGILRSTSVGFLPLEVDPVRDNAQRAALGLGEWGVVFERSQLLEISVVSVPMNPEAEEAALREAVERGILTGDEAEYVGGETPPTERDLFRALERYEDAPAPTRKDVALVDADAIFERLERMEDAIRRASDQFDGRARRLVRDLQRTIRSHGDAVRRSGRDRTPTDLASFADQVKRGLRRSLDG